MERKWAAKSGQVRCHRRNKEQEAAPGMGLVPVSAAQLAAGRDELALEEEKEQNSQGRQRMGQWGNGEQERR